MRFAHVSDTHLGYAQYHLRERKEDFFKAFERVVDRCLEEGVELFIHAGDLFESYHPDVESLSFAVSQFKRLKDAGVEVLAIGGNHDRAIRKGILPPQKLLQDLGLIKFLDPVGELVFKDVLFIGFRYLPKRHLENFKEEFFPKWEERVREFGRSVLLIHQAVSPFVSYPSNHPDAYEVSVNELPPFSYFAAGHIHLPRVEKLKSSVFSYAGSTEFRSLSEALKVKRGFNIVDLDKLKVERVELEGLRPFFVLKTDKERAPFELKELKEKVLSSQMPPVVSVIFEGDVVVEKFSEVLREIERKSLHLRILKRPSFSSFSEEFVERGVDYGELLKRFCSLNNLPSKVSDFSLELLNHSPEEVGELVLRLLKEEMGEFYKVVEGYSELFNGTD
ncbi:metallophosphoesterase family protein [Thermovibrio sp.]